MGRSGVLNLHLHRLHGHRVWHSGDLVHVILACHDSLLPLQPRRFRADNAGRSCGYLLEGGRLDRCALEIQLPLDSKHAAHCPMHTDLLLRCRLLRGLLDAAQTTDNEEECAQQSGDHGDQHNEQRGRRGW